MKEKQFCKYCGGKIIKKETRKGSYSKNPDYFDEETGKEINHEKWECENAKFFNTKHSEYYLDISNPLL